MKKYLVALVIGLIVGAVNAAEPAIHLNQKVFRMNEVKSSMELVLERTLSTPKNVAIELSIPAKEQYCARQDTRIVYGQDASCGTGTRMEYSCREESICRDVQNTCRDANGNYTGSQGPNGMCDFNGSHRVCDRYQRCGDFPVPYTLSCNYSQSYCAEYATRDIVKIETIAFRFVRLDKLKAGQTQRMELNLGIADIGGLRAGISKAELNNLDLPGSYKIKEIGTRNFRISRSLGGWIFDR